MITKEQVLAALSNVDDPEKVSAVFFLPKTVCLIIFSILEKCLQGNEGLGEMSRLRASGQRGRRDHFGVINLV